MCRGAKKKKKKKTLGENNPGYSMFYFFGELIYYVVRTCFVFKVNSLDLTNLIQCNWSFRLM